MALYRITNLSAGTVILPPPFGKRLNRYQSVTMSAPSGSVESNYNRNYSTLSKMASTGLVSVVSLDDERIENNIETPTIAMMSVASAAETVQTVLPVAPPVNPSDPVPTSGDPLFLNAQGEVSRADTDTDEHARIVGIARYVGDKIYVVYSGLCLNVLGGTGIAGKPYYLAQGGGLSTTIPDVGQRVIQVGIAKNENDIFVRILDFGRR